MNTNDIGYEGWYKFSDLYRTYLHKHPIASLIFVVAYTLTGMNPESWLTVTDNVAVQLTLQFILQQSILVGLFMLMTKFSCHQDDIPLAQTKYTLFSVFICFNLMHLSIAAGLILFIIPAIPIWFITMLAPLHVWQGKHTFIDAFRSSYDKVKGNILNYCWALAPGLLFIVILLVPFYLFLYWLDNPLLSNLFNAITAWLITAMSVAYMLLLHEAPHTKTKPEYSKS